MSLSVNRNRFVTLGLIILLLTGIVVGLFFEREPTPLEFQQQMGVSIISPPVTLPSVNLVDHEGKPFKVDRLKGRWSLLFFGYTHCPDVCPTTLTNMNQLAKQPESKGLNYIFISLDPKRDTPQRLKEYVQHFNPEFIGVSGEKSAIDRLAEAAGVIYEFEGDTGSDRYNVNHYAAILVVDPKGRLRAHILPPHPAGKMVSVVTKIREYYGE
jgi:protein SCO1